MAISKEQVLAALRRVKGPDMQDNIVDLGLVSEILIREERVYFSVTVTPDRAAELEPLRQAEEKVVRDLTGVKGVTAVLTAEAGRGGARPTGGQAPESPRVQAARAPNLPAQRPARRAGGGASA